MGVSLTRSAVGTDLDLEALDLGVRVRDPAFGTALRRSDLAIVALGLAATMPPLRCSSGRIAASYTFGVGNRTRGDVVHA